MWVDFYREIIWCLCITTSVSLFTFSKIRRTYIPFINLDFWTIALCDFYFLLQWINQFLSWLHYLKWIWGVGPSYFLCPTIRIKQDLMPYLTDKVSAVYIEFIHKQIGHENEAIKFNSQLTYLAWTQIWQILLIALMKTWPKFEHEQTHSNGIAFKVTLIQVAFHGQH